MTEPVPAADTERWGKPPRRKARPGTKWLGKWERTTVSTYTTGGGDWDRDRLAWMREYLELDGHEDCCHHTWPVFVLVEPAQYDGEAGGEHP